MDPSSYNNWFLSRHSRSVPGRRTRNQVLHRMLRVSGIPDGFITSLCSRWGTFILRPHAFWSPDPGMASMLFTQTKSKNSQLRGSLVIGWRPSLCKTLNLLSNRFHYSLLGRLLRCCYSWSWKRESSEKVSSASTRSLDGINQLGPPKPFVLINAPDGKQLSPYLLRPLCYVPKHHPVRSYHMLLMAVVCKRMCSLTGYFWISYSAPTPLTLSRLLHIRHISLYNSIQLTLYDTHFLSCGVHWQKV